MCNACKSRIKFRIRNAKLIDKAARKQNLCRFIVKTHLGNKGLKVVGPVNVGAINSSSIISSVSSSPAYDDDDLVDDCNGNASVHTILTQL